MNALQELIAAHCADTGESIATVAARGGLSRQTVSGLVNRDDPSSIPRRATLAKLAVGLNLSLEVVEHAAVLAASQVNGEHTEELRLEVLMDQARQLDDAKLRVLLATARALRAG